MENQTPTQAAQTVEPVIQPTPIKSGLLFWSKHVWKWAPKPSVLTLMSDGNFTLVDNSGTVLTANVSDLAETSYGSFGGLNLIFKDGRKFRFVTNPTNYSRRPNEQLKQALNSRSDVSTAAHAQFIQTATSLAAQAPLVGSVAGVGLASIAIKDEFVAAKRMAEWAEAFSRFTKVTKSKTNGMKLMLIIAIPVLILIFILPFILGPLLSK